MSDEKKTEISGDNREPEKTSPPTIWEEYAARKGPGSKDSKAAKGNADDHNLHRARILRVVTTREVWRRGLEIVRANSKSMLPLVLVGMLLPQLIFMFAFDVRAEAVAETLRAMAENTSGSYQMSLLVAFEYLGPYVAIALLLWILFLAAYLGLTHIAVNFERSGAVLSTLDGLKAGLRTAVPGGILLTFLMMILALIGQVLVAPALIVATLGLVVPVLMVAEKRSVFGAIRDAMTLRYLRHGRQGVSFSGWNIMLMLMVQGCFFYACVSLVSLGAEALMHLDDYVSLPRILWTYVFPGHAFGPLYVLVTLLEATLSFALLGLVPAITTAIYFMVAGQKELGQA